MGNISVSEVGTAPISVADSSLEHNAVRLLGRVPGLRGLAPSRRLVSALRGGTWSVVGFATSQVLKLGSTLVLARLLVPQAFGLVALVNVFLSGLEMLSDLGVGMDVVQHPRGDDPRFISTAFLIQAGRGIILWTIATVLAYPFARFYNQPAVLALVVAGSLSVLLRGLTSGSMWELTRHVQVGKYNVLTIGSDFFGFLVSLIWGLISPSAWALVVGRIASTLALVIASHWIAEHAISLDWDAKAARELFAFGAGIFLSTATYFLSGEAERLVVGKFLTLAELGCFSLALSISSAASKGLQQVIVQVFFPMMSDSLRENRDAAVRHYKKAKCVLVLLSSCLGIGFILGSHLFVAVVLGAKYEMAGWMLQLLGVRGALELFISATASMLFALGTSRYAAIGNIVKFLFLAGGLTIAFGRYGFREALWVMTLAPLANYIPLLFGLHRHCRLAVRSEIATFSGLTASFGLTAMAVLYMQRSWGLFR
jgi:O-antigen/teichoic acid export membrane protein